MTWGADPDAIQPGIFGPSHDPSLTRTDYVANSNNSLRLANPKTPLTSYPTIFGPADAPPGMRPRLSLTMIADRLAGTDGYGPPGFTLTSLQATALGERDYSAELGRDDIVAMCRTHPHITASNGASVDVATACTALAAWNTRADLDSSAAVLWREFFAYLDGHGGSSTWSVVPYNPAQPLTTPSGINGKLPAVQTAFADAVQFFQSHHIPLDDTLASAQRYAGIPLPGCTDLEGCFALGPTGAEPTPFLGVNGTYDDTTVGNGPTFIMAVELTPNGPQARSILSYSESANPDSPHHTDQTELLAHKQWVTDRFTQPQIAADPTLQTTILHS